MKPIERLRQLKSKSVERMKQLNDKAKSENRDLNEAEKATFEACKEQAESLEAQIVELSKEENPGNEIKVPPTTVDADKLRAEGAEAERLRATSIREACSAAKLPATFADELLKTDISVDQARAKVLEELAKKKDNAETLNLPSGAGVTQEQRDKVRLGITAALFKRIDPKSPEAKGGEEFAGLTLLDMARESLGAVGVKTRGMSRDNIVTAALKGFNGGAEFFSGMMSSSDFPNILADVANKRMRLAYSMMPRTYEPFTRKVTVTDFKSVNALQISDLTTFQEVDEHGEFQSATLTDSKETYQIKTYGEVVRITRKTIINDDMRALDAVPAAIGKAAARLENETVWSVITTNAAMGDSVALFHATHKNLNTSNTLALAGLGTAKTALRKQTQPNGAAMNLTPRFLIVPAALETTALQLLNPQQVYASDSTKNVPLALVNGLTPIVEPLLDASSATVWYLACDPNEIDTIHVAYLEGQDGVYIETRNGFEVDGVEIKGRLDFGCAAVEYRGLQKNA